MGRAGSPPPGAKVSQVTVNEGDIAELAERDTIATLVPGAYTYTVSGGRCSFTLTVTSPSPQT